MRSTLVQALFLAACLAALRTDILIAAEQVHPGLYLTPEDIKRGERNVEQYAWAQRTFKDILAEADKWASMPEDSLREILPPLGAKFAYGFTSCPACGSSWPWWGTRGVCDLTRPRTAKCPTCERVFPDKEHPDDGDGWLDEKSGRRYWFVGAYNSYVAQTLTLSALNALSNAYALTGDEEYARTAAVIFDALAKIYPTCAVGSIDYPHAPGGRLERTQYQVARVLVLLANYYDLIYDSPALNGPSQAGEPTIRASIEERILKDGAGYCYKEGNTGRYGLTNGEADYVRGVLAVGLLLGIQSYIDWALEGPYSVFNFLENNLLRDGQYYETSVGYSQHALSLYMDMAEMLANYRSPKYPSGVDLYHHPKLSRALARSNLDLVCAGHLPRFGDWGPDVKKREAPDPYVLGGLDIAAERMYRRSRSPAERKQWADLLNRVCAGEIDKHRAGVSGGHQTWLLYHAEPVPSQPDAGDLESEESLLLDGAGVAILRSESGPKGRAALVRYGPSVCHGHMDDLNLNFFALGRELTYDLGYSLGSSHVQVGWARQTASHNLVVVNEKSQMGAGPTGGSAHLFASSDQVKLAELSSERSYKSEDVTIYRRTVALVDGDPGASYLVDIFRVAGGHTHDLIWHAFGDELAVDGVKLGEVQGVGSLAGAEYDWGRQIGPDGDINGQAGKGPYWNAPPQNGYGFLYDVQRGPILQDAAAVWTPDSQRGEALRITVLPSGEGELIVAKGPAILPSLPVANYAIVRRKGTDLESAYVSVLQPYSGQNPVEKIEKMAAEESAGSPVGLRIGMTGGRFDYVVSTLDSGGRHAFHLGDDRAELRGRFAFCRFDEGSLAHVLLSGASHFAAQHAIIDVERASYWGTVEDVDYENCRIVVNRELPADGALVGAGIYIGRPEYGHKSYYKVASVRRGNGRSVVSLDTETLVLGKGYVIADAEPGAHAVANVVPLEMSCSCVRGDTGYFKGKLMEASDGTQASIIDGSASGGKKTGIPVVDASQFKQGQRLTIYDIQEGDSFEIPSEVVFVKKGRVLDINATSAGTLLLDGRKHTFGRGASSVKL